MITMKGEKMASRVAASILHSVGLNELICNSYIGKRISCIDVLNLISF